MGGEWLAPRPGRFTPREWSSTHWVGPRAGLHGCKKSRSHRDLIPKPSSPQVAELSRRTNADIKAQNVSVTYTNHIITLKQHLQKERRRNILAETFILGFQLSW